MIAQPDGLAAEYLKSMGSVIAALLGLQGLYRSNKNADALRVLCIGVGGGTLPLFLAHHFPGARVDAVELDPIVMEAAVESMGLPTDMQNLILYTEDAVGFLQRHVEESSMEPYDLICIDAFDGNDDVPAAVCSPDFAEILARALHAEHGMLVMNFHSMDVSEIAKTFYKGIVLLESRHGENTNADSSSITSGSSGSSIGVSGACRISRTTTTSGCCFTVSTQKQKNLTLACTRKLELPNDPTEAKEKLRLGAVYVASEAGYRFPAGSRAGREYSRLF